MWKWTGKEWESDLPAKFIKLVIVDAKEKK